MEKIVFSKERDNNDRIITLKTVDDYKDFKEVIKIFSNYPYYEILSDKDCMNEYELYEQNGFVIGCYVDDVIAGINCVVNKPDESHSIKFFDDLSIAYHSGFAVKNEFRKQGLGKLLIENTDKFIVDLDIFDYEYARILNRNSMSEGIFKKYGFIDAYDQKGQLIVDDVNYIDLNGDLHKDRRRYMVKSLNNKGKGYYRR